MGRRSYYYAFFLSMSFSIAAADVTSAYTSLADMLSPALNGLCIKKCACKSLCAEAERVIYDKNSAIVRKKFFKDLLQKVQKVNLDDADAQCFLARCSATDKVSRFLGPLCKPLFKWQGCISCLRKEIDTSLLLTHAHCALLQVKITKRPQGRVAFYMLCYLLQRVWAHVNEQEKRKSKAIGAWDGRKMAGVADFDPDQWDDLGVSVQNKTSCGKKRPRGA